MQDSSSAVWTFGFFDPHGGPAEVFQRAGVVSLEPLDERKNGRSIQLSGSKHLTDYSFLALAVKHGDRFATFETGINAQFVPGGKTVLHVIPTS